jgi:DNA recombination protein Rad52
MPFSFSDIQVEKLVAPLSKENVKQRKQNPNNPRSIVLSYIEGWHAIAEANRIFGFGAWSQELVRLDCVSSGEKEIGVNKRPGWEVTYLAVVRISLGDIVREGVGSGHGIDVSLGMAHESASKEAATDAMKRAFMTFGNQFGLALYDKEQTAVADQPADTQPGYIDPEEAARKEKEKRDNLNRLKKEQDEKFLTALYDQFVLVKINPHGIETLKDHILKVGKFEDVDPSLREKLISRLTQEYAALLNQGKNSKGNLVNPLKKNLDDAPDSPSIDELEQEADEAFG